MNKQLANIIIALLVVLSSRLLFSMNNDQSYPIKFRGKTKDLLALISKAKLNKMHPFSVTLVFRYEEDNFIRKSEIFDIDEQDLEEIKNKNFVYCNSYCTKLTRLNPKLFTLVDAIIVGTKDEVCAEKLRADNKALITNYIGSMMRAIDDNIINKQNL